MQGGREKGEKGEEGEKKEEERREERRGRRGGGERGKGSRWSGRVHGKMRIALNLMAVKPTLWLIDNWLN